MCCWSSSGACFYSGFGLWLVGLEDVGGAGWVQAAIGLFIVVVALGLARRAAPETCAAAGRPIAERGRAGQPELRALLDDLLSRTANYTSAVLVLAILALMVFKP